MAKRSPKVPRGKNKLKLKKETIRDLDAAGKGKNVKGELAGASQIYTCAASCRPTCKVTCACITSQDWCGI